MIALQRLRVQNFLSLQNVDVRLGDLNVLVGPNASGKSNLLKVFQFLGDTARDDLGPAVVAFGGMDQLLFRGPGAAKTIRIALEAHVTRHTSPQAVDEYELNFRLGKGLSRQGRPTGLIRTESFKFKRTKGKGRRITIKGARVSALPEGGKQAESKHVGELQKTSAGLSVLRKLGEDADAPQWRDLADLFLTLRVFEPDVAAARLPGQRHPSPRLESDASNLATFLDWLAEEHSEIFALLVDDLRAIVPSLMGIEFIAIGGATEARRVVLRERHLTGTTDLAHASFGTVRALAILAMLHDPNPPKLTLVEEIDHGLHPWALDRIVERLRSATRRTQLLLATHSPALVNRLRPDEIIVCERDPRTGASLIPAIDPADVEALASEDDLSLGELWFSGALGGVLD